VTRRNIDKAATLRMMLEDKKDKEEEIKFLTKKKDKVEAKVFSILDTAEEIGDEILATRPKYKKK
ncbi:hypothetical protein KI387_023760, partial [Taxus chinensis]